MAAPSTAHLLKSIAAQSSLAAADSYLFKMGLRGKRIMVPEFDVRAPWMTHLAPNCGLCLQTDKQQPGLVFAQQNALSLVGALSVVISLLLAP